MKQRRKSRIVIGSGGVLYLIATALIVGAAIYTQANLLFWGFGLMVGGGVVSMLLTVQTLRGIQVQRLLPGHAVCGEACIVRYHVTNRSLMPVFSLFITETWGKGRNGWKHAGPLAEQAPRISGRPTGWVMHIGPQQSLQAEATCWPVRRGAIRFERMVISTSFPFGILRKVVEIAETGEVLIYPRLHRMSRRTLSTLAQADQSGRKHVDRAGGNEEFFGLREYRFGDSLKLVDWKHTARLGKLVAREMTLPSPPRIMVLLDLRETARQRQEFEASAAASPPPPPRRFWKRREPDEATVALQRRRQEIVEAEERAISLTASVLADAYFHGYQIGMGVEGAPCRTFPVHHSLPHRVRLLEALSRLETHRPDARGEPLLVEPSVIIHPGHGDRIIQGGRWPKTVLGAADLETLILQGPPPTNLLAREAGPVSRRVELEERAVEREAAHAG